MCNNPESTGKLCPFKKKTVREDSRAERAEVTSREKFEYCAGERCMAFHWSPVEGPCCLRLKAEQHG